MKLIWQVYDCDFCERLELGFKRAGGRKGFFKFPPTIGATGQAALLFVGINPRMSAGNAALHRLIMSNPEAFEAQSQNRVGSGSYIRNGGEPHYQDHLSIVEGVFGRGAAFEQHAAVSELFYCATESADGLPCATSPCANTYFSKVFAQVKPVAVVCVGKGVANYFQRRFGGGERWTFPMRLGGHHAHVLCIAHPNDPETSKSERRRLIGKAIEEIKRLIDPSK